MWVHPGTDKISLFLKNRKHSALESEGSHWTMGENLHGLKRKSVKLRLGLLMTIHITLDHLLWITSELWFFV